MRRWRSFHTGVHLKTAGTTWLEEIIGLAEAGGKGLKLAKEIYAEAFSYSIDLCAPYATVIDINPATAARARGSGPLVLSAIHLCLAPRS